MSSVFWFRKDLRLQDNEALTSAVLAAHQSSNNTVYCVYGFNSQSFEKLEGIRQHSLSESIKDLANSLDGKLNLLAANTNDELASNIVSACSETGSLEVFAMQSFDPREPAPHRSQRLPLQGFRVLN